MSCHYVNKNVRLCDLLTYINFSMVVRLSTNQAFRQIAVHIDNRKINLLDIAYNSQQHSLKHWIGNQQSDG